MPHHGNAAHNGAASRNSLAGCFRNNVTPQVLQAQLLIGSHRVRPELAPVLANLAFGGGRRHG